VAFCNGSDALRASARAAGMVEVAGSALMRNTRSRPAAAPKAEAPAKPVAAPLEAQPELELAPAAPAPVADPAPAPAAAPTPAAPASTMVIDKPLRSGQRIYARGCDLIVLDIVSAGAEIIADGNIHVYAPLRGRAIAGALGDADARIFATCFEPELVAIAGVYRTFENDIPDQLAQKPVQVTLGTSAKGERSSLQVQALALR
jgi:septum site-determining protein MinC